MKLYKMYYNNKYWNDKVIYFFLIIKSHVRRPSDVHLAEIRYAYRFHYEIVRLSFRR
jgi:hypothetical protein